MGNKRKSYPHIRTAPVEHNGSHDLKDIIAAHGHFHRASCIHPSAADAVNGTARAHRYPVLGLIQMLFAIATASSDGGHSHMTGRQPVPCSRKAAGVFRYGLPASDTSLLPRAAINCGNVIKQVRRPLA